MPAGHGGKHEDSYLGFPQAPFDWRHQLQQAVSHGRHDFSGARKENFISQALAELRDLSTFPRVCTLRIPPTPAVTHHDPPRCLVREFEERFVSTARAGTCLELLGLRLSATRSWSRRRHHFRMSMDGESGEVVSNQPDMVLRAAGDVLTDEKSSAYIDAAEVEVANLG